MKAIILVSIFLFFTGCASSRFTIDKNDLTDFTYTEIPLEFSGYENHFPIVVVHVQGIKLKLMLDSGHFDAISLNPEVIDSLDLIFTGRSTKYQDAYGSSYKAERFIIPSIKLGDLEIKNVAGLKNDTSPPGFDGTVGHAFLRNFNVLVDYAHNKLTLYRKGYYPEFLIGENWFRYRYRKNSQFKVRFDSLDGEYDIGLDTGSGVTAIPINSDLGEKMRASLGERAENRIVNERTGEKSFLYRLNHLYLNGYDLGSSTCVLISAPAYMGNGTMGFDFFNNNRVFIDFNNKEVWLKSVAKNTDP